MSAQNPYMTQSQKPIDQNAYFNPMDGDLLKAGRNTWVGGPTHSLQDQHIPNYTGHIHGKLRLNLNRT